MRGLDRAHPTSPAGKVTVCSGVATIYPAPGHNSPAALVAAADKALYLAKAAGRDRVVELAPEPAGRTAVGAAAG